MKNFKAHFFSLNFRTPRWFLKSARDQFAGKIKEKILVKNNNFLKKANEKAS